jgi:hypothetical protein
MAAHTDWLRKKKPCKHSWMTDKLKKKLYGDKSPKYNGFTKVKKILLSFIEL